MMQKQTHKADNLLSSDTYRKWKAAKPGEKQISVILQVMICPFFLELPHASLCCGFKMWCFRHYCDPYKLVASIARQSFHWDQAHLGCNEVVTISYWAAQYYGNIRYVISVMNVVMAMWVLINTNIGGESELQTMQTLRKREALFPFRQYGFTERIPPRYSW